MKLFSDKQISRKSEFWIFFAILSLLSLFMVWWYGPQSEYSGHDYYFHLRRFGVLIDALRNGNYPTYLDYGTLEGYGYFTRAFYPDLMLVPFAAIGILTGTVLAYNIMIFTFTLLCGLFMYYAANAVFKSSFIASVSSILYTFSVYHLFDWYDRGALGEAISFTFLPLIFLGLYHIITGDYKKWYILTIGYTLLIYTHVLSSFLTSIAVILILLICSKSLVKEPKRILYLLLAGVVTLPLVAGYLLPMLEQMSSNTFYYSINENDTGQNKLSLREMLWGLLSGVIYHTKTWDMKNICGTGPLLILLVILRIFVREKTTYRWIGDLCLLIGLIFLFMISSLFPWGRLPLGFIQFPWRLYEFVVFFFAVAGTYYLSVLLKSNKQRILAGAGIVIFTLVVIVMANNNYTYWQSLVKGYASPAWFTDKPTPENRYHLGGYEYLPVKVPSPEFIHERGDMVRTQNQNTEINAFSKNKGIVTLSVETALPDKLELPLVYYKGYKAMAGSKELSVEESDYGLLQVSVDESADIQVYYAGTGIQKVSWYFSLLSIVVFIGYIILSRRKLKDKGI